MTEISARNRLVTELRASWCGSIPIAPLITFRVLFGLMMAIGVIRFWANGWIGEFYIKPEVHFSYYGFEWVTAPGPAGMYMLFGIMLASALGIMVGWRYRISAAMFFLSFT